MRHKALRALMMAADGASLALPPATPEREGDRERILIVRLDALGDLVLFLDALRGLRELYPASEFEVTLAVNALWTELLAGQELVDRIMPVDRARFLGSPYYRYRTLRVVRNCGFHIALNPTYSREAMLGDSLVRATGAARRLGWSGSGDNMSRAGKLFSDRWYTTLFPPVAGTLMELERNALFVRHAGLAGFEASLPRLRARPRWLTSAARLLEGVAGTGSYAVFIPGTGPPPERNWPPERWAALARRITDDHGLQIVLCGSSADRDAGGRVSAWAGSGVVDLTGRTSLAELAGLIAGARFVAGSDTGPVHLASALRVPAVCLLGGGFPGRFFPYPAAGGVGSEEGLHGKGVPPLVVRSPEVCGCPGWVCVNDRWQGGTFPCISGIDTGRVVNAVAGLLALGPHMGSTP